MSIKSDNKLIEVNGKIYRQFADSAQYKAISRKNEKGIMEYYVYNVITKEMEKLG